LEKLPFDFRYEYRCGDVDCKGHHMICTDWEMDQSYRSWRGLYGDGWEAKFRERYETEMIEKNDTHFFVGTLHQFPSRSLSDCSIYHPRRTRSVTITLDRAVLTFGLVSQWLA
jgi:hypothetical protein